MKFNCGETPAEKFERLENWHRWFAWHPVRVGSHDCRWLEYVERKGTLHYYYDEYGGHWWTWEYRARSENE